MELYRMEGDSATANGNPAGGSANSVNRGVSRRSVIEEAKALVPTVDLVSRLANTNGSKMRRTAAEWVTHCVLPDHRDRSPSFTANPEKNLWFCHGCVRGGDVVDLARLAWGYREGETAMAAANLLHEFGHPIPEKPPAWYARQKRQKPIRDAIEAERLEHIQDLVFRLVWKPWLQLLPDETRRAVAASAWEKSHTLATMLYERARGAA
jgi:hypothetical protein